MRMECTVAALLPLLFSIPVWIAIAVGLWA
jgi:hypothetical protein